MSQDVPDVSVVICTFSEERWNDVVAAVQSVQQQDPPPLEVIVVIDHNPGLLERVRTSLAGVIAVDNKELRGASEARNSGFAVAKGCKIAFLDDDAVAEPGWLMHLSRWCDEPYVLGAGGQATPLWLGERPRWFPDEFGWVVGCTYKGMPETTAPIRNLSSANLCIRRDVFELIGGFRRGFGKVGTRSEPEDTEICIRALQQWPDRVWIHEPRAVVRHKIPASRSRWKYFVTRCYHEGLGKAALVRLVGSGKGLASERSYTWRTLPKGIVRGVNDVIFHGDLAGLARSGAIVAGLTITSMGYVAGLLRSQSTQAIESQRTAKVNLVERS